MDRKKICVDAVQRLAQNSNVIGFEYKENAKAMAEAFNLEHRTIQQNVLRLMASFLHEIAKVEHTDPRNETSIEWAKKVDQIDTNFPFI